MLNFCPRQRSREHCLKLSVLTASDLRESAKAVALDKCYSKVLENNDTPEKFFNDFQKSLAKAKITTSAHQVALVKKALRTKPHWKEILATTNEADLLALMTTNEIKINTACRSDDPNALGMSGN